MHNNLLLNTNFERITNSYNPGWDASLNTPAGEHDLYNWSLANMGVSNSSTGYHTHLNYAGGDHGYVLEMVNKAPSQGRWIGSSQEISAGVIKAGHIYTLRFDAKAVDGAPKITGGLYYTVSSTGATDFNSGQMAINPDSEWNTYYYTFTTSTNLNESSVCHLFFYGQQGGEGTTWIDNVYLYEI